MNTFENTLQLFEHACTHHAEKTAFSGLGQALSYADLYRLSGYFATFLQDMGLQKGDRMVIQLPNLLHYPVALWGAMRAGVVVVNTNPLYTTREMTHQYKDSGARLLVIMEAFLPAAQEAIACSAIETIVCVNPLELEAWFSGGQLPFDESGNASAGERYQLSFPDTLSRGAQASLTPVHCDSMDIALLQYTGGTTGIAKGAMLTHGNLLSNRNQIVVHSAQNFREGEEITVCPLPLYHIYAFTVNCLSMVSCGCHTILIANPRDIDALIRDIKPYPFTGFVGINTLFNALLHHEDFRQLDFSSLKSTTSGGMALNTEIANAWKALTGVQIAEGYGLTETSPVVLSNPPDRIQPGTVGLPVPHTEVKVVDNSGRELATGEAGELCVKGPQVMLGYWQRPEATAEVLSRDGWLHTGDIAVIQEDGYVRIVDRKKDMIVVSGFNVYPNEIEDIATQFAGVLECAAVSVADDVTGEAVKLFVVAEAQGCDMVELKQYLKTQLTAYKVPRFFEFIDQLPKSNVGKVLRRELR